MEDRKPRREARKKQQQWQAHGCFLLICLTVFAIGAYIIYIAINPGTIGGLSTLEPNPYAPSDFAAEGAYVTCTAGPTRMGIDVSEHQGEIDWAEVRAAGFDFAFIRIGYRGYSVGEIFTDELARENLAAAKAAGFEGGVYFSAQAISTDEALEEAQWCLEFLSGEALDLPVVYDWEYVSPTARTGSVDRATLTACVKAFCEEIEKNGYESMIYFNNHVSRDLLGLEAVAEYPFWLAQYKDQMDFPHRVDLWQYTETGSVPGVQGDVDIDLMFIYE